jgi:hypothetical protein
MTLIDANLIVASALAGLIWTIQLVHYPLFGFVGPDAWASYGQQHRRRITWLAAPLMTANVGLAGIVLVTAPSPLRALNAGLSLAVFTATGLLFAPLHARLERSATDREIRRLVRANWARTAAWTLQVAVAATLL